MKHTFSLIVALGLSATAFAQQDTLLTSTLDDVVVTGSRSTTTTRNLPATVSVVGRQTLTADHRTALLPTLAEQVPGLFATQRGMMGFGVSTGGSGALNLRGITSSSGQLLVLIDGHPQYNGIYGHSMADAYQTMMAERVEVLRGPASVLYGSNAMGGVVNIVTRQALTDGVRTHASVGAGSWGTLQAEVSNMARKGRFSSTAAAQYQRTDNHRPHSAFYQYGGHVRLSYDISHHWQAFALANVTHFSASCPGPVSAPLYEADQWITRGVATLALENHYDRSSGRLSIYDNWGRHKINDGYGAGAAPQNRLFRSRDALVGVSWYQDARLWQGGLVTVGVDYQHIYGHAYYTSRATGEVIDTPNKQSGNASMNEVAAYVDVRQSVTPWLTLDAGVRYDHHSVSGGEWVPQGGLVIHPMTNADIKLTAGKGFRNPTMREMYLYPPSNEDLLPERLMSYELSWRHKVASGRVSYGINLFLIEGDNMIQTINRKNVNTGAISNRGAEAEATWRITPHWQLTTNHSFLHMKHPVVGAPAYKGYLGASMHRGRWTATAGIQQICGLYTEVAQTAGSSAQRETYTLLNATLAYRPLQWLEMWIKGDNLLNQRYEINAGYPMPRATFMAGVDIAF